MNEQQQLLSAIWDNSAIEHGFSEEGVAIYHRNLLANAKRGLAVSFPTLFELLDGGDSDELVAEFLRYSPPNQGDWGQWGGELAGFLESHRFSEDFPYLADCAALDWAVHQALHGADVSVESASLARLGDTEPSQLTVEFNPNVSLLSSEFPIVDIYNAHHLEDESSRSVAFGRAKERLQQSQVNVCIVYRLELQPKVMTLNDGEMTFVTALLRHQTLEEALDLVADAQEFSFENWLLWAIENNVIQRLNVV